MKKRFMLVAVLLGSLALASCVDDKESDSVTAIRNAKVERLKAAAAADYAQAAYTQAQAAIKQVEASVASETKAAEIEKILAEYKKAVEEANRDALYAQSTAFSTASNMLSSAYSKYISAVATLQDLQKDALEAQAKLARAEVDSAATQTVYQEYVAQQTATILKQTAILERLKAIDENSLDKDELNSKLQALAAQAYTLKSTDKPQADVAAKAAAEEVAEAYAKIAPSAALAGIIDPSTTGSSYTSADMDKYAYDMQVYEDNLLAYVAAAQYLQDLVGTAGATANFFNEVFQEFVDIDGWWKAESEKLFEPAAASDIAQATIDVTDYLKGNITTEKATLGTKKTDTAAATGLYLALENAEATLKTKQDALADAKAANPVVPATVEAAEAAVATANVNVLAAQEAVADQEEAVKEAEDALAEFNAALEVIKEGSDAQKEYAAAIEALVKLQEAKLAADKKLYEVELAINTIGITGWSGTEVISSGTGEYSTLLSIYNGVVDVKEAIATCEKEIAQAELNIEKGTGSQFVGWEYQGGYYWDPTVDTDGDGIADGDWVWSSLKVPVYAAGKPVDLATLKAQLQADLDFIKEKIALQEGIVAEYKAALEALINSEE